MLDRIVFHTKALKLGAAIDKKTDVGPVIDEIQLKTIIQQVSHARALGASILCGGNCRRDLGGYFFEPTVLTGVNHQMEIMTRETFGPVMPIMVVDSEDEAVSLLNDSEYGLTASVWARNIRRAESVARDLNAGTVFLNDCLISHACPQVPVGRHKKSGFGRSHSVFGLMDLVNIKHISIDTCGGPHRLWWYPYGPGRIKVARGGIKFLHGSLSGRINGLIELLSNLFANPKA